MMTPDDFWLMLTLRNLFGIFPSAVYKYSALLHISLLCIYNIVAVKSKKSYISQIYRNIVRKFYSHLESEISLWHSIFYITPLSRTKLVRMHNLIHSWFDPRACTRMHFFTFFLCYAYIPASMWTVYIHAVLSFANDRRINAAQVFRV